MPPVGLWSYWWVVPGKREWTQVGKKSAAGLESSLRRAILDSLLWKTKKRIKSQPASFGQEVTGRRSAFCGCGCGKADGAYFTARLAREQKAFCRTAGNRWSSKGRGDL